MMKQDISALMDGELFDDEAEALFDGMKRSPDARAEWHMYHLVGDALRQPGQFHSDIRASLHERLQAEPTILAPRSRAVQKARWFAVSAAASLMGLGLVAWMSVQVGPGTELQMAMQQQPSATRPASYSPGNSRGVDDYLMAHQEYSPGTDVQGAAAYVRTVADRTGR